MSNAYLLALHSINNMGPSRLKNILEYYGYDAAMAWHDCSNWRMIPGLTPSIANTLAAAKKEVDVEAVYEKFLASGASLLLLNDPAYPELLANIYDPPLLLFYYGQLPEPADITVAMIGTRRPTPYGRQVAQILARDLAMQGIWVVSGMARGIDSICHQAAIEAGGKTIAVIGSGIDIIYPPENGNLFQQIIANGAVISELPLGSPPLAAHFPMRNRIISGLSKGVVVVEAGKRSGTLLTVDRAMEQGRDVFSVPGLITSKMSSATNALFAQGAKVVTNAQDIWQDYLPESRMIKHKKKKPVTVSKEEKDILDMMAEPIHFDSLLDKLDLPAQRLAAMLTMWEIRGLIKQLPGKYYILAVHEL
ncbi:MAG: DNA-processing protein DprA [Bacillota bacterium]